MGAGLTSSRGFEPTRGGSKNICQRGVAKGDKFCKVSAFLARPWPKFENKLSLTLGEDEGNFPSLCTHPDRCKGKSALGMLRLTKAGASAAMWVTGWPIFGASLKGLSVLYGGGKSREKYF